MKTNCYITTRTTVPADIMAAIDIQTLPCEKKIISRVYPDANKVFRILKSKEAARAMAVADNCDFAIIHEDDVLNLMDNNFQAMLDYLLKNENCGAVVLGRKNPTHVCCGVTMFRRKFLNDPTLFSNTRCAGVCSGLDVYFRQQKAGYEQVDKLERIIHYYGRNN